MDISELLSISEPPRTPSPRRYRAPNLTRDQRRDILNAHQFKHSNEEISATLGVTLRQVEYTLEIKRATPKKASGPAGKLSEEQLAQLEEFVTYSRETRRMTYQALTDELDFGVKAKCIRLALKKLGFSRRVALRKPPLSDRNKALRLEWAREHIHWSEAQWWEILWSDETWVNAGKHRKVWITRRPGEELHPDYVIDKIQRKQGWMFWGCFAGATKGPVLF
jgi:transposase